MQSSCFVLGQAQDEGFDKDLTLILTKGECCSRPVCFQKHNMDSDMGPIGVRPPDQSEPKSNGHAIAEDQRPKFYTAVLGRKICRRVAAGKGLPELCRDGDMPELPDLMSWLFLEEISSFTERYLAARSARLELLMDETVSIADSLTKPEDVAEGADQDKPPQRDRLAIAKLRIDTRKWIVEKQLATHLGDDTAPTGRLVPSEILRDGVSD